jgi:hypothetical protein
MAAYVCKDCCEEFDAPLRPRLKTCPGCGEFGSIVLIIEREKGDDDGVEYGDPRDERDERRGL